LTFDIKFCFVDISSRKTIRQLVWHRRSQ